mmetsp:Transcript_17402/g.17584  ORF Transcript_17402/g.17584 Transcript_17402/m.17584 type:complete len:86 (-) Transcript_17402:102-359(-)
MTAQTRCTDSTRSFTTTSRLMSRLARLADPFKNAEQLENTAHKTLRDCPPSDVLDINEIVQAVEYGGEEAQGLLGERGSHQGDLI